MKPENCYVATLVGVGRTASLRFKEVGTFNYVIESSPEDRPRTGLYDGTSQELKVKGTIIVK